MTNYDDGEYFVPWRRDDEQHISEPPRADDVSDRVPISPRGAKE